MTRVKICGLTNVGDAQAACAAGADMLGLVFAESPRRVTIDAARRIVESVPPAVTTVGVFLDADSDEVARTLDAAGLAQAQLHGDERPEDFKRLARPIIKRIRVNADDTLETLSRRIIAWTGRMHACLLDPGAGGGRTFDWSLARGVPTGSRLIISGGLTAANVGEAVRMLWPWGVDASSGVEASPGRKDHDKLRAFIEAVRRADADRDAR